MAILPRFLKKHRESLRRRGQEFTVLFIVFFVGEPPSVPHSVGRVQLKYCQYGAAARALNEAMDAASHV